MQILAVLPESMISNTYKCNIFIRILFVHHGDRPMEGSSINVIFRIHSRISRKRFSFSTSKRTHLLSLVRPWVSLLIFFTHIPALFFQYFFINFYQLWPCIQTGKDMLLSTICLVPPESHIIVGQPTHVSIQHVAFSWRPSCLPTSSLLAGSDLPVCRRNAATIEPQFTIGEPDIQNSLFSLIWTRPGGVIQASILFETCSTSRLLHEQSSHKLIYWFEIDCGRLVINRRVWSAFVDNEHGGFF